MKKSRIMIYIALCLCMTLSVGCKKKEVMEYEERTLEYPWDNIIAIEHSETGKNFCIVDQSIEGPSIIPDKYVIDSSALLKQKVYERTDAYTEIEKFDVKVYDFNTLKLAKKINMKGVLSPYANEYEVFNGGIGGIKKGDRNLLVKTLQRVQTEEEIREEKEREFVDFYYDIDTGEVEIVETDGAATGSDINDEAIWMLVGTEIMRKNISENTEVRYSELYENLCYINTPVRTLPEENEKLYGMFPGLKKLNWGGGSYAHIYITPYLNNLEAISLILDDNEELNFKALKPDRDGYYGSYRKNGKIHWITQEEYEGFQKEYHEYREKEREGREARRGQGIQE